MARFTLKTFVKLCALIYAAVFLYALTNYKSRVIFSQPDFMFEDSNYFMISNESRRCRLKHSELNRVNLNLDPSIKLEDVIKENPYIESGGIWQPSDCEPWQKVMIIVPYRDRAYHLRVLLNRLHPMLQRQKVAYQIFIAEQAGSDPFARGRVVNIAFVETMKTQHFDCIIVQVSVLLLVCYWKLSGYSVVSFRFLFFKYLYCNSVFKRSSLLTSENKYFLR